MVIVLNVLFVMSCRLLSIQYMHVIAMHDNKSILNFGGGDIEWCY